MRMSTSGIRRGLIILVSLFACAGSPAAGQGTVASIIGQVTDQSGAVLPGVTVTATSPALQVPQVTAVTNEVGEFRLSPLPIGAYGLSFELAGFRPVQRQNVRLTVGFTARIDVSLGLATVAETVTVSGATPVVDITATSGSTLLTRETLQLTPTSRNGNMSFLTLAPGVRSFLDVGGNQMVESSNSRAFGQSGGGWATLEGIATSGLSGGGSGGQWDEQAIEEARVQTLGTDAEFGTHGVQLNAIVKSGGNDFHGGANWAQTDHHFQSNNIDEELEAIGITSGNKLAEVYDVGGDLGGRIVRNKVWFYGALRRRFRQDELLNAFKPDGSPAVDENSQWWNTEKVSFQWSPSNRFIGFYQGLHTTESSRASELVAWESREVKNPRTHYAKAEWEGVRGNSLIATAQFGIRRYPRGVVILGSGVGRTDLVTERVTGDVIVAGEDQWTKRDHTTGSLTWYKPNWYHGNHEFKAGIDHSNDFERPGLGPKPENYHLLYEDGVPFEIAFINAPTYPKLAARSLATYIKDSWTVGRRLTLNLGLRYTHDTGYVPEECRDAAAGPGSVIFPAECFEKVELRVFNSVAPRLHAAYDLGGDGKTVLKGGWGRYDHMRQLDPDAQRVNQMNQAYGIYLWHDLNGNSDYNDGEVNRDPNGPDFVETTGPEFDPTVPKGVVNPNEKQFKQDEFSASFERELVANFAMRVTGVYSRTMNMNRIQNNFRPYEAYNIPITNRDPGPDGERGTADDAGLVTYYEFSPELAGAQYEEFMVINDPVADATYKSVEVAAVKRLANRWQFMASYSATKKDRPLIRGLAVGSLNTITQIEAGFLNPNEEINRSDRTWD
jgi:Carboxypeptidase regulatory-like domain